MSLFFSNMYNILYSNLDFYGKDNKEATRIDQILDTLGDLLQSFRAGFLEKDETKKVTKMHNILLAV